MKILKNDLGFIALVLLINLLHLVAYDLDRSQQDGELSSFCCDRCCVVGEKLSVSRGGAESVTCITCEGMYFRLGGGMNFWNAAQTYPVME